jgi:NCAIR mutase (PurE)-related protein
VNERDLQELLESVRTGRIAVEEAARRLSALPYEDLGFARIDHHRVVRRGYGEAIFCAGKTVEQTVEIARRMVSYGHVNVLATRADTATMDALEDAVPVRVHRDVGLAIVNPVSRTPEGLVCVCSAGTSDMRVAEEAALTAEYTGSRVERLYDVGVAGVHRLLAHVDLLREAHAVVAVAGMEGALASVVAGLVQCPVVAVPTSVGYGASFGGVAALLSMLNSCSPGVSVVNIDNGYGAGYLANVINRMAVDAGPEGRDAAVPG